MHFVLFQFSHLFLADKIWLITSFSTKQTVKYGDTTLPSNLLMPWFDRNLKSIVVLSQLFYSEANPFWHLKQRIFYFQISSLMRVDFFCFFGEILLYDFASAANELNLIFRTHKKSSFVNHKFCQISRKM